ncbi:glucosaminidase domain-containing protein [Cohnella mopanensis]|uniref:glucosaminidase domain-containing protein n=1 Tax=Cohnella mopanensis TaxID=2911966 RepID=UPI001EF80BBF|nr:glucosaminidase domain-containing protein [Cohnella mopanensis]
METVGSAFRRHPELEPTGKLSLLGKACCSAERMDAYLRRRNPRAPGIAGMYLSAGERYGVRGDVAFCQMMYETRGWTIEISGPTWWPRSLAQWSGEDSIEAHMQILYSLATELPLSQTSAAAQLPLERLDRSGWLGKVLCWEDLNSKWSAAGHYRYGQDIVAIWRNMLERRGREAAMRDQAQEQNDPKLVTVKIGSAGRGDGASVSHEQLGWLRSQRLLPVPAPHPDQKVTWGELAIVLHRWENRSAADTIGKNKESLS